ncbi:MAG: non-ribosomal peptide synthetase [Stackebrandtia sp.]
MTPETLDETAPDILPLTDPQQGLLIVDRMVRTPHLYNTVSEIELAPVDAQRLREVLARVVAVQPGLRTVLAESPAPHGRLLPPPSADDVPLEVLQADADHDAAVAETVDRLGRHAFALAGDVLYRFALVRGRERATLVLVAHHVVFDGYSLQPLVGDLARLLAGSSTDEEIDALRLRRERLFRAELAAQQRTATDEQTKRQAEEWAEQLRGRPGGEIYPRPHRPAETRFAGRRTGWRLDDAECVAVRDTCRGLGVSPFTLFTAVYGAVLARYTGVGGAVMGSPFLSRRTAGSLELCGFFVNTLPVAFDVDWDRGFDAYVRETAGPAVDLAKSRTGTPFSTLIQHLRPDRSTNRNPVFSCMIVMQDAPPSSPDGPVRGVREHGNGTAKFDVWLGVTSAAGRWELEIEYDEELLPAAFAGDLADSLRTALRRAAANTATRVGDLFADESLEASLTTDGYPSRPETSSLTGWLADVAAKHPSRTAVEDGDAATTYRQLEEAVERTACGLRELRVGVGDVVGLHLDNLTDTVVGMLAIMRCGAAYLPLDASLPSQRLRFMIERSGCELALGSTTALECRTVGMAEVTRAAEAAQAGDSLAPPDDPETSVYVMFSSGSTGEPKGIDMGQAALANLTGWQIAALEMGPDTRFMQYAPLGFDVSFQEIVPTLAVGGAVVSRSVDRRDFPALVERVDSTAVTHVYLPVAALRAFTQAAEELGLSFAQLRYLCVSGEQLLLDEQEKEFFAKRPHCTLVNLYGPTETHAVVTHRLSAADPQWPGHAPIGLPLAGVAAYVVDSTGRLAPRGVAGELYLGGRCPAKGYINAPELTAERFLPDRFAGSGVMYRTGDQVLRDEHGALIFLGRNDEQVKIRGYRVELGEIEAAANGCRGVRQAVAATREAPDGRELLLFALVESVDPDQIRKQLQEALPAYMVPARVFPVEKIPATANGKFDRAELVAEAETRIKAEAAAAASADVQYRDSLERELAELWGKLIHQGNLDADRSLLESGAHSLTVFAGLAEVRRRYGVAMPIAEFFRTPTIAAVAEAIRVHRSSGGSR